MQGFFIEENSFICILVGVGFRSIDCMNKDFNIITKLHEEKVIPGVRGLVPTYYTKLPIFHGLSDKEIKEKYMRLLEKAREQIRQGACQELAEFVETNQGPVELMVFHGLPYEKITEMLTKNPEKLRLFCRNDVLEHMCKKSYLGQPIDFRVLENWYNKSPDQFRAIFNDDIYRLRKNTGVTFSILKKDYDESPDRFRAVYSKNCLDLVLCKEYPEGFDHLSLGFKDLEKIYDESPEKLVAMSHPNVRELLISGRTFNELEILYDSSQDTFLNLLQKMVSKHKTQKNPYTQGVVAGGGGDAASSDHSEGKEENGDIHPNNEVQTTTAITKESEYGGLQLSLRIL